MAHSNEFLAIVFSAYWGAEVFYNGTAREVFGVNANGLSLFTETDEFEYAECGNCQLLLTPLSDISDEDAIEVAKIEDKNIKYRHRGKAIEITNYFFIKSNLEDKVFIGIDRFYKEYYFGYSPLPLSASLYTVEQTDYLRSKSYDCGYAEIPSLITAGIAVKNNQGDKDERSVATTA